MHTDGKIAQKEQGKKDGWKMAPSSFLWFSFVSGRRRGNGKGGKIKEAGREGEGKQQQP